MSAIAWVWVGVALWLAVAVLLALVLGMVIRSRDNQVPQPHAQDEPVCPKSQSQSVSG